MNTLRQMAHIDGLQGFSTCGGGAHAVGIICIKPIFILRHVALRQLRAWHEEDVAIHGTDALVVTGAKVQVMDSLRQVANVYALFNAFTGNG